MENNLSLRDRLFWSATVFVTSLVGMVMLDKGKAQQSAPPQPPPIVQPAPSPLPSPQTQPQPVPPPQPTDPELIGVQVPVPKEIRIYNKSGSQCVWCTAEMLGRLHKVKGVDGLTIDYKHATGPGEFNCVMTQRHINFKQVTGRDLDFIEEWVTNKKMGVGIGVHHSHVILVCHFERGKQVKVIDNSDRSLKVQTWDWQRFQRSFTGWVFVILPDNTPTEAGWNNNVDDGKLYHGCFSSKCVMGGEFTYNGMMRMDSDDDRRSRNTKVHDRQAAPQVRKPDEEDAG
jgi:hypothetical protein